MEGIDITTTVGEDGNFTDEGRQAIIGSLGDEFKDFKGFDKYNNVPDLLKGAANAQKMLGQKTEGMVKLPGQEATPEEIQAFRETLGVPAKAEDYEIKWPEAIQDEETKTAFSQFAHSQGLTPAQAQAALNFEEGIIQAQAEAQVAENAKAKEAFDAKYGDEADKVTRLVGDAMTKLGFDKVVDDFEASGLGNNPKIIDWFNEQIVKKIMPGQYHQGETVPPQAGATGLRGIYNNPKSAELTTKG